MEIKSINKSHVPQMMKLDYRFHFSWHPQLYQERLIEYGDLAYGAFDGDELVGFVIGKRQPNGNILLSRIVVRKDLEGKGLGSSLFKRLSKVSKETIESTVRTDPTAPGKCGQPVG